MGSGWRRPWLVVVVVLTLVWSVGCSAPTNHHSPVPSPSYLVTYSAHFQGVGWLLPVADGTPIGTTERSSQLESLSLAPAAPLVLRWRGQVQGLGWQPWRDSSNNIGTTGRSLRLEAFEIMVSSPITSHIEYRAKVQDIGWQPWVRDGQTAGTVGRSLRIEAVRIKVSADLPVTLGFTADTGMEAASKAVLAEIGAVNPDVTNLLGDLSYQQNSEQAFCDQVTSRIPGRVLILAGNHENVATHAGLMENYEKCLPPEVSITGSYGTDYFYDIGSARVILISPNVQLLTGTKTYAVGTPERRWLIDAVRSAKAEGKWVILGMHYSCLSIGLHGCNEATPNVPNLAIALGVDVVLAGHDHNYSRTHQLAGTYADPQIPDKDNMFSAGAGTVFAIVGNGGHNPRAIGPMTPVYAIANGTNSPGGMMFGFGYVSITPTTLVWRLIPAYGNRAVTDTFTITR